MSLLPAMLAQTDFNKIRPDLSVKHWALIIFKIGMNGMAHDDGNY